MHNNWADGTPPAVYVYTDRLEIISTGGLPPNLSKEDFFKGVSKPVNEELAKLFIRLDLMEQTGYGVPLVTEKYGEKAFEFLDFFLRVTIPFAHELKSDDAQADTPDPINDPINDPIKLLKIIEADPELSYKEYAEKLGVSPSTIKRRIYDLKAADRIVYIGARKNGRWKIIDKVISEVTSEN